MLFNSPISSEKANLLIGLLALDPCSRVIDVGCGSGEFLTRVIKKYNSQGIGVDTASESLAEATTTGKKEGVSERIDFVQADIREFVISEPFDCGICLGATHAYSMNEPAYPETLKNLGAAIKPGGLLLIGESYWIREPDQEYVEFVGEPSGTYRTHRENIELAADFSLSPLYATTSTLDEWDDFEWRHHMRIEKAAEESPLNPDLIKRRDFGRAWRSAYLKWGRGTLGFGFYLFKKL